MATVEKSTVATRRHGAELDEAIRQAVRDELEQHTYTGVTFEGVARRAQTSKPVIYRRYSSRAHMVIDAWLQYVDSEDPQFVSSGDLRSDLFVVARTLANRFELIGIDTMRGLLAEMPTEHLQLLTEPSSWVIGAMESLLNAAHDRGDITRWPIPARLESLPLALARDELIFTGAFGDEALTDIIDTIWLPLLLAHA